MFLPTPIGWMKKILAILKSDLSPNQIGIAAALGVFAGLPPIGLHVILPISLALLLRCSFRSFLLSMGAFKLISLAVAPISYELGKWLLDPQRGLDAFWKWLVHLPVIAPMGYSQYILMGSLALALVVSVPCFFLIRWAVRRYRTSLSTWISTWRISQHLRNLRGMKWVRKLLVGGERKYDLPPSRTGFFRIIRREMLIGLPLLYAFAVLLTAMLVPFFTNTVVTESVSWATGTEVAVEEASFNLLTGNLTLVNFSVQDPKAPEENLIAIPTVKVNAGLLPLIANRIVFDSIAISDAELHVKREVDGTLNIDNAAAGWDVSGYLEWASQYADSIDWIGLLRRLLSYLENWNPLVPREDPYAAYAGSRTFPDAQSPLTVRQLEIGRLLITLEDEMISDSQGPLPPMTMLEVEASNLAFPAALRKAPTVITLHGQWGDDTESGFRLSATISSTDQGGVSTIAFAVTRLDLPRLARFYATTLPVSIRSGLASLSGTYQLDGEIASGSISFLLEELNLAAATDQPLFGLPEVTSDRVIAGLNQYAAEIPLVFGARIEGTAEMPVIAWEAPLLGIAREGLLMMGKREFNRTIVELADQIDGLGGISSVPLDPVFQPAQQGAQAAARSLIEHAGGGLLLQLPSIGEESTTGASADSSTDLSDLVPGLLNKLLDSASGNDDTEGSASGSD